MRRSAARIDLLRGQAGEGGIPIPAAPAAAGAEPAGHPLRPHLDRIRAGRGPDAGASGRVSDDDLAATLGGRHLGCGLIEVRADVPGGSRWGNTAVDDRIAEALVRLTGDRAADPGTTLFLDTETTGLSGGTGTVAFLIGFARFEGGTLRITQHIMARFAAEPILLDHARERLNGVRTIVTYNGKSFDAPLLEARFRLHRRASPLDLPAHLDLLPVTRRAFSGRWPDCRLQTVEKRLLAMRRVDDLTGAQVPETWFRWVRSGDGAGLPAVIDHNRRDLVSLAVLPRALLRAYRQPVRHGASILAGARLYRERGQEEQAFVHLLRRRAALDVAEQRELGWLARRRRDWTLATSIWRALAACGDHGALVHLAKYNEHVAGNLVQALALTRSLLASEPGSARHRRRASRLTEKLRRSHPDRSRTAARPPPR